jgi:hypothetical protein
MQFTQHPCAPWLAPIVFSALLATAATAHAKDRLDIRLSGYSEVPSSLSTPASGRFKGRIDEKAGTITYELSYSGLTTEVRQAHIHIGRRALNGGIMVWLCQTATNVDPTGLSPICPQQSGSVSGVIQDINVIGPAGQGVAAGAFQALVDAIRADAAYVNVHSAAYPGGEIRGQLRDD